MKLGISDATIDPERRSPQGTLTIGLHYAHSPMWLDPQVYNSPVFNHFLYIVHDALIKPMAGNVWTYSLAESAEMPTDYTYAKFRVEGKAEGFVNGEIVEMPPAGDELRQAGFTIAIRLGIYTANGDGVQCPLRSRFPPRLMPGVRPHGYSFHMANLKEAFSHETYTT